MKLFISKKNLQQLTLLTFITICIGIFSLPVNQAMAHSVLKNSSPQKDEVIQVDSNYLELTFNTKIEPISTIELYHKDKDNRIELDSMEVEQDKIVVTLADALPNGSYRVVWKIVGQDGHPVHGQYSFSVQKPEAPSREEPTVSEDPPSSEDPAVSEGATNDTEKVIDTPLEKAAKEPPYTTGKQGWSNWPILLLVALLILLFILWATKRRKRT